MIAVSVLQIVLITIGGLIAFYFSDTTELLDQFGWKRTIRHLKSLSTASSCHTRFNTLLVSLMMLGSFINRMEDLQQGTYAGYFPQHDWLLYRAWRHFICR